MPPISPTPKRLRGALGTSCAPWGLDPPFDKGAIRRDFGRAAATYDRHAHLQRWVAERVAGLFLEHGGGDTVLDAGSGTGFVGKALAARGALPAHLIALDMAHPMTRKGRWPGQPALTGDCEQLPLSPASLDTVVSSLTLQWVNDLATTLMGFARCLREEGILVASTLAAGTLAELQGAMDRTGHGGQIGPFLHRNQMVAALTASGLSAPHCWEETWVQEVAEPAEVFRLLKGVGAVNKARGRSQSLQGRSRLQGLGQAYRLASGVPQGPVPITWRVAFLTAQKASPRSYPVPKGR